VFDGQVLLTHAEWAPAIGLDANFRLDGLALMFALLISGIGLLIVLYAAFYLGADDPPGKFFSLLMLFMAAMLGIVLADNLVLLVVFWELTSVSSFLLVGFWGAHPTKGADARAGARMALAVTGGGGLALLAGVVLLARIGGSFELSVLLTRGDVCPEGSGRERVRATAASMSRSVRSFQVQPAPRIRKAPSVQPAAIQRSKGRKPAGSARAARARPHQQGMSRSQVPMGRSARERRR
jgi:formate hydrogenlyase subunit 3/multisubunit Na+/H+ antiporter MnhD subunit